MGGRITWGRCKGFSAGPQGCYAWPSPMKVTFVRPNLAARRSADALEPLCFALLKGLTPPDVETVLHDERLEDVPFDEPTDLVALTVETYTARRGYQIAAEYRKRGVPVVMGGYHPT